MADFIVQHRATPEISLQTHMSRRQLELWRSVEHRHRVYLDQRFWIILRDAAMGFARKSVHGDLLETLRSGVRRGALVCPLSESAFWELQRQKDPKTRLATARLMDELSRGLAIQYRGARLRTEIDQFFSDMTIHLREPRIPIDRVWVKVGHVFGTAVPVFHGHPVQEQEAVKKAFVDVMWEVTLEELLTDTASLDPGLDAGFREAAARKTRHSKAHMEKMKSFRAVFLAEIAGFIDVYRDEIGDVFATRYRAAFPGAPPVSSEDREDAAQKFAKMFYNLFRLHKEGNALPMARVVAGLHAIVRWNKTRVFEPSDHFDFHHAAAALPYCDYFLTEKFLGTVVSRPPLSLDSFFGTTVSWDEVDATNCLKTALGE